MAKWEVIKVHDETTAVVPENVTIKVKKPEPQHWQNAFNTAYVSTPYLTADPYKDLVDSVQGQNPVKEYFTYNLPNTEVFYSGDVPLALKPPAKENPHWPVNWSDHLDHMCSCNHILGSHYSYYPNKCGSWGGCHCPGYIPKEVEQMKATTDYYKPTQKVLDLVPGSVEKDWHRHDGGGWVYKNAKVDATAYISETAVVYDSAIIGYGASVHGKAKVFGNAQVGKGCSIYGNAKIGGNAVIGQSCNISGYTKIFGKVGASCVLMGKTYIKKDAIIPAGQSHSSTPQEYRTQKARGVSVLKSNGFNVPENALYRVERLKTELQLKKLLNRFVRPCPVTPRHGFVESRPVTTLDQAKEVVKATKAADKQAEIITMPFIQASHSGVWTDGQLTIGPGNDGATSGKNSYMIPVQGRPEANTKNWDNLLKDAGITQAPYLEVLWTKQTPYNHTLQKDSIGYGLMYVQLRDGPKLPQSVDFIPAKITVEYVIEAKGDLLEWETAVKKFRPGTVVHHPGGSLASHYAVHAYLSNIPVLVSREPKVGETLEPNTSTPEANISQLRQGFLAAAVLDTTFENLAYIMMAGCHSTTLWMGRNDFLLGMAMGACYRLIITASLGEYRHKDHIVNHSSESTIAREKVYAEVWGITLTEEIRKRFSEAMSSFDKEGWTGSMGGANWYILSRWAALLHNALLDGDIKAALEYLNKGVNSVHNGGWTFNKFITQYEMNYTAKDPVYALIKIAPFVYDAVQAKLVKEQKFEKFVLENIDPEKYLAEKAKKKYQAQYKPASSNKKLCCNNDCCGNPDCLDCHPAIQKQLSNVTVYNKCTVSDGVDDNGNVKTKHNGKITWVEGGGFGHINVIPACENHIGWFMNPTNPNGSAVKDVKYEKIELGNESCPCGYGTHSGPETLMLIDVYGTKPFPVCEEHLKHYNTPNYMLYKGKTSPESELDPIILNGENDPICSCGDHNCADCYPEGCGCQHESCHDCGESNCEDCNPTKSKCSDPSCDVCYPETETQ